MKHFADYMEAKKIKRQIIFHICNSPNANKSSQKSTRLIDVCIDCISIQSNLKQVLDCFQIQTFFRKSRKWHLGKICLFLPWAAHKVALLRSFSLPSMRLKGFWWQVVDEWVKPAVALGPTLTTVSPNQKSLRLSSQQIKPLIRSGTVAHSEVAAIICRNSHHSRNLSLCF